MKRRTRTFVRRQANWFKENDPDIHWFQMTEDTLGELEKLIGKWLKLVKWDKNKSK
jgi:tRNA dimethylallyltransferase